MTERQMSPSSFSARTEKSQLALSCPNSGILFKGAVCYFRGKVVEAVEALFFCTATLNLCFLPPIRYVFFLDPCNVDIINRRINSIALCVSKCPSAELKTYNDLKQFALTNGERTVKGEW